MNRRCDELCECEYEPQIWNLYTHRRQLDNVHIVWFAGIACMLSGNRAEDKAEQGNAVQGIPPKQRRVIHSLHYG